MANFSFKRALIKFYYLDLDFWLPNLEGEPVPSLFRGKVRAFSSLTFFWIHDVRDRRSLPVGTCAVPPPMRVWKNRQPLNDSQPFRTHRLGRSAQPVCSLRRGQAGCPVVEIFTATLPLISLRFFYGRLSSLVLWARCLHNQWELLLRQKAPARSRQAMLCAPFLIIIVLGPPMGIMRFMRFTVCESDVVAVPNLKLQAAYCSGGYEIHVATSAWTA